MSQIKQNKTVPNESSISTLLLTGPQTSTPFKPSIIQICSTERVAVSPTIENLTESPVQSRENSTPTVSIERGKATVPVESIGAFSAILPRWNRSLYLRFDLGKTSSNVFENSGFTSFFCGQKYRGKG